MGTEVTPLADDILRGVKQISMFTGLNIRATYYALEKELIPAGKEGTTWVASKTRLREHYAQRTAGKAA